MKHATALLLLGLLVANVDAPWGFGSVFPRLGLVRAELGPGALLVLADSDEGLLVSELTGAGFGEFAVIPCVSSRRR